MKKHSNLSIFIPNIGCPNRCVFCDQSQISGNISAPTAEEVDSYCRQYLEETTTNQTVEIAFFGGSFTAINRQYMLSLLRVAEQYVDEGKANGIRISTRPDAINYEILDILKKYQVTAIELGAQSMNDRVLALNFRGHTREDVLTASSMIKEYDFSLGLQMMIGMYGEEDMKQQAVETAREFISIKPDTIRIYPTLVLKETELERLYLSGKYLPPSLDESAIISAKLLLMFEEKDIKVIRIGLHDEESLKQNIIAGPFHPAFGELTRSYVMRHILEQQLKGHKEGEYTVYVSPKRVSSMVGLNKMNINYFLEKGYILKITGCNGIELNEIQLNQI